MKNRGVGMCVGGGCNLLLVVGPLFAPFSRLAPVIYFWPGYSCIIRGRGSRTTHSTKRDRIHIFRQHVLLDRLGLVVGGRANYYLELAKNCGWNRAGA